MNINSITPSSISKNVWAYGSRFLSGLIGGGVTASTLGITALAANLTADLRPASLTVNNLSVLAIGQQTLTIQVGFYDGSNFEAVIVVSNSSQNQLTFWGTPTLGQAVKNTSGAGPSSYAYAGAVIN